MEEERSVSVRGFDPTLLRRGEITAAIGALIVLLGLFVVPWYGAAHQTQIASAAPGATAPAEFGAWSGAGWLGTLGDVIILTAALGAFAVAVAGARGIELDGSGRRLFLVSVAAVAVVLLRLAFRPTAIGSYHFDTGLRLGIFLTLVGTLVLAWGARTRLPRRRA